ncbi:aromatic ring-hydroxylating dioxygenase subunit alpha [Aquabacterium sp. J223]|uniref:aromatic ring-hydroxylating oxygenase subunit alpha n=1 Tax=Aquabacterium sp. J223 TaxID=2898431 RepID=UPI0021AD726F|nr:aromatic ring-hydroxylating dioxygenase subunit alpha [Aquabacterium sp. J223]UUX95168.1 aromatic ring-hydroxylating dioxygenase subunit alpha [Aquabacterium sp. J223]
MKLMDHPVFRRFWYPTLSLASLQAGPQAFTLLGERVVLWLTADGRPAAVHDRCPHRSARLSVDSAVVNGDLRCGYHGWQFGADGRCTSIPQLGGEVPPDARNRVKAYRCEARYGFAWVCLSEEPLLDIPVVRHADDPAFRQVFEYEEDWAANMLRVCENALDLAHVSFVHRATIGEEHRPVAPRLTLRPLEQGVHFTCQLPVANPEPQQRNLRIAEAETLRTVDIRWYAPCTFVLHFTYPNGLVHQIVGFATPIDDGHVRRIQFAYRSDREADAPAESVARFDRQVGAEDRRILESCDPDFPLHTTAEAHMVLDRPGITMREVVKALILEHDPERERLRAELGGGRRQAA